MARASFSLFGVLALTACLACSRKGSVVGDEGDAQSRPQISRDRSNFTSLPFGKADLRVEGPFGVLRLRAPVDFCERVPDGGVSAAAASPAPQARLSSVDANNAFTQRYDTGETKTRAAFVSVSVDGKQYWTTGLDSPKVSFDDGRFAISTALVRTRDNGEVESVMVRGTIDCPPEPKALALPESHYELLKELAGKAAVLRRHATFDSGRDRHFYGASALVPADDAAAIRDALRERLGPDANVFIGARSWLPLVREFRNGSSKAVVPKWWGREERAQVAIQPRAAPVVEVVVAAGRSIDAIRLARSSGEVDGDALHNHQAVEKWDQQFGLEVLSADTRGVELRLRRVPPSPRDFAAEAAQLTPDPDPDSIARAVRDGKPFELDW